ncbi:MAG: hypothetical protein ABIJ09_20055 [Pseudomonadota bacterium]
MARPPLRLGLTLLLFAAIAALFPMGHFGGWTTTSKGLDWGVFQLYNELTRWTLLTYHQFPFWNPYFCGGTMHWANPQSSVLSLWTLIDLVVGAEPGLRLRVAGMLFIAMAGMYAWARSRGLPWLASTGAALAFGLSGYFAARIGWGHQGHFPFAYLPLVMLCYEAARERLWAAVGVGAVVALMMYDGGAYPLPMTVVLLALRAIVDMVHEPRQAHRIVLVGLVAGIVALGLAAPKLLPMFDYLTTYPRQINKHDRMLLSQVIEMFLGRDTNKKAPGWIFNRYEYFNYLGPIVVSAALWGLWRSRQQPFRDIYIVVGLVMLIMIGDHGTWSPAVLMRKLPLVSGMRNQSRYTVIVGMYLALVFGYALVALSAWLSTRRPRWQHVLPLLLIAGFTVDSFTLNRGHWPHNAFVEPPRAREDKPFAWRSLGDIRQYERMLRNEGSQGCFEGFHIPGSPNLKLDTPEFAWLVDPSLGQVQLKRWSPNQHTLRVRLSAAGRVLLNQNNLGGWHVDGPADARVVNQNGLLGVDLPAGEHDVVLFYRPRYFGTGVLMTAATVLGLIAVAAWSRLRRRRARRPMQADTPASAPAIDVEDDGSGQERAMGGAVSSE